MIVGFNPQPDIESDPQYDYNNPPTPHRDRDREHESTSTTNSPQGTPGHSNNTNNNINNSPSNPNPTSRRQRPESPPQLAERQVYRHRAQVYPVYVLDRISQAHYKVPDGGGGSADSADIRPQTDHFVSSMNGNLHNLLRTIEMPPQYTPEVIQITDLVNDAWKLDGQWGGEERLRQALVGSSSSDNISDSYTQPSWWRRNLMVTPVIKTEETLKLRSRAGYWMLDEKRQDLLPTLKRISLQNPMVPLILRIFVIFCLAISLALAGLIFVLSRHKYDQSSIQQQPLTIMAIVVQCVAIVYLIYIAVDEYKGKPLGLRDPVQKLRLILLDLFFIIFSLANLLLAFNTLFDNEWVCEEDGNPALITIGLSYPTVGLICRRQRALLSFLLVALVLWVFTFTISIVRVVHRVSTGPQQD